MYDGQHDHEKAIAFDMIKSSVLASIASKSPDRAATIKLLGEAITKPNNFRKPKLCIFSKKDGRRRLANADQVQAWLTVALPDFDVKLISDLGSASFHDQAWSFYTCDASHALPSSLARAPPHTGPSPT